MAWPYSTSSPLGALMAMTCPATPARTVFISFITSMMPMLWLYEGELDASGRVLELGAEGPSMSGDGSFVRYIDAFELVNDDERVLSSRMQNPDGSWTAFMRSVYRRVR